MRCERSPDIDLEMVLSPAQYDYLSSIVHGPSDAWCWHAAQVGWAAGVDGVKRGWSGQSNTYLSCADVDTAALRLRSQVSQMSRARVAGIQQNAEQPFVWSETRNE